MKKTTKRILAMMLTFALIITSVFASDISVNAAKKTTKITMNAKKATLSVGQIYQLKVKSVKPKGASNAVKYKSNKKKIATVSAKGVIKAKKKGKATITVTAKKNKKAKATFKVTVKAGTVNKSIKFNTTSLTLEEGKASTLKVTWNPAKTSKKTLTWTTSNANVAKVSNKGVITAVKAGSATITATNTYGKKATCRVTVKATATPKPTATPLATDTPATDTPATDTPATDTPATDTPATDTPATDTPATDTPTTGSYEVPSSSEENEFYLDLNECTGTMNNSVDGASAGAPSAKISEDNVAYEFSANNQFLVIALTQEQKDAFENATSYKVDIQGTSSVAGAYRYGLADNTTGSNWNKSELKALSSATTFDSLKGDAINFANGAPADGKINCFVLQSRDATAKTATITSIKITVNVPATANWIENEGVESTSDSTFIEYNISKNAKQRATFNFDGNAYDLDFTMTGLLAEANKYADADAFIAKLTAITDGKFTREKGDITVTLTATTSAAVTTRTLTVDGVNDDVDGDYDLALSTEGGKDVITLKNKVTQEEKVVKISTVNNVAVIESTHKGIAYTVKIDKANKKIALEKASVEVAKIEERTNTYKLSVKKDLVAANALKIYQDQAIPAGEKLENIVVTDFTTAHSGYGYTHVSGNEWKLGENARQVKFELEEAIDTSVYTSMVINGVVTSTDSSCANITYKVFDESNEQKSVQYSQTFDAQGNCTMTLPASTMLKYIAFDSQNEGVAGCTFTINSITFIAAN